MAERSWLLTYRARPWLVNAERAGGNRGIGGHYGRSALVKEWRQAYAELALEHRVPPLEWIQVEALQLCKDRRLPDIGNCYPAVKAAIDGLVDAGVIPDDKGDPYLHGITFKPPATTGYDALVLRVTGPPASPEERRRRDQELQAKLVRKLVKS